MLLGCKTSTKQANWKVSLTTSRLTTQACLQLTEKRTRKTQTQPDRSKASAWSKPGIKVGWLLVLCRDNIYGHYQDKYRLVTVRTHGGFIV